MVLKQGSEQQCKLSSPCQAVRGSCNDWNILHHSPRLWLTAKPSTSAEAGGWRRPSDGWRPTSATCAGSCPSAPSARWRIHCSAACSRLEWALAAGSDWPPSAGPWPWPSRRGGAHWLQHTRGHRVLQRGQFLET